VAEDGRVFVTSNDTSYATPTTTALALDEATGAKVWSYDFTSYNSVGQPAVFDGRVFVTESSSVGAGGFLWCFDAALGTVKWAAPMQSGYSYGSDTNLAPIAANGVVFTEGGYYGSIYGFKAADGSQVFGSNGQTYSSDQWSPAWDHGVLYNFSDGNLYARSPTTGAAIVETPLGTGSSYSRYSRYGAPSVPSLPALGGGHALVVSSPDLAAVNLTTMAADWTASAAFTGSPAVASGTAYAITAGMLEAREVKGLALDFTFPGDVKLCYPPVVAGGHVYVASPDNVYAIDLKSQKAVWSAKPGGWLSVARGRLYVARADGKLDAWKLTP
jgi:outer membrane protein assembly factor BamB